MEVTTFARMGNGKYFVVTAVHESGRWAGTAAAIREMTAEESAYRKAHVRLAIGDEITVES
jgi:hypothetical protein